MLQKVTLPPRLHIVPHRDELELKMEMSDGMNNIDGMPGVHQAIERQGRENETLLT